MFGLDIEKPGHATGTRRLVTERLVVNMTNCGIYPPKEGRLTTRPTPPACISYITGGASLTPYTTLTM